MWRSSEATTSSSSTRSTGNSNAPPAADLVRHDAGGFRFTLEAPEAAWLRASLIPALDRLEEIEGATVVKRNNVRTVVRVPFPEAVLYVKRYHVRGPFEWAKYLVRPSRAVAEWRAARALAAAGLPTVRAVIMGEKRAGGVLLDGMLATVEIPGAMDFVPYLHEHFPDHYRRGGEDRPERVALLDQLADLVRRFHDAGFTHGDLHSGNLLVTGPPEASTIHLIDLHTVGIGSRVGRRTRVRNLAKLLHSLSSGTSRGDRLRFVRHYAGDADSPSGFARDAEEIAAEIERRMVALERRRVRSRTRRCLRRSSSFDLDRAGVFRLYFRREIDPGDILDTVKDHLRSRGARGDEMLKDSRRSAVSRQELSGVPVVVKEAKFRGAIDVVKDAFRRSRGLASWINGTGLEVRKVGAARPLALVVQGAWPLVRGSFFLMEDLSQIASLDRPGHDDGLGGPGRERLDLYVLRRFAGPLDAAARARKRRLVEGCAAFVRDLHSRGIYHGDLKGVNLYVSIPKGDAPRFLLVDYDRVAFLRSVSRRRRIKNLAQLAASIPVCITRTDRLRFFCAYAFDDDARRGRAEYNAGVVAACEKKIVVRMSPIE